MSIKQTGTGKRRRIIVNGKRIYVIATRDEDGNARASWTMPHENRKQMPGKRPLSPYEAQEIKAAIKKLLKEI